VVDQNSYYGPTVFRGRGNYQGLATATAGGGFSPEAFIYANYHPTPETTTVREADFPQLKSMADAILKEPDAKKRTTMMQDWVRQAAADMPTIPVGAVGPAYRLSWAWVAKVGVYQRWLSGTATAAAEVWTRYWYDKSKAG
jgi:ABC-type transport system substrate-binding protein